MPRTGTIKVICGPMRCGKSLEVIRIVEKYNIAGKKVLIVKPTQDTRDGDQVISRIGLKIQKDTIQVNNLKEINEHCLHKINLRKDYELDLDLLVVDEFHFFKEDFIWFFYLMISMGVDIVVSGLDISHQGHPFKTMSDIMGIADDVIKLKAICTHTKQDTAVVTLMKNYIPQDNIPGDDAYEPVCRQVWLEKMMKQEDFINKTMRDIKI